MWIKDKYAEKKAHAPTFPDGYRHMVRCTKAHCTHYRKHNWQAGVGKTMARTTPSFRTRRYDKTKYVEYYLRGSL